MTLEKHCGFVRDLDHPVLSLLPPEANYNSKGFMGPGILLGKQDGFWSMEIWVLISTPYIGSGWIVGPEPVLASEVPVVVQNKKLLS